MSQQSLRQSVVSHQLDDLNALGEALAAAARDSDADQLAGLRATLGRFALAMGWNADTAISAIVAYGREHGEFEEDLFGPAFVLRAIAPGHPETVACFERLPPSIRDLVALTEAPPY